MLGVLLVVTHDKGLMVHLGHDVNQSERDEHAVGDCCACGAHFSGGMCLEKNDKKIGRFFCYSRGPTPDI